LSRKSHLPITSQTKLAQREPQTAVLLCRDERDTTDDPKALRVSFVLAIQSNLYNNNDSKVGLTMAIEELKPKPESNGIE
jgi:hypothetical protein